MSQGQVKDKRPSCSLDKGGTEMPKERCRQSNLRQPRKYPKQSG